MALLKHRPLCIIVIAIVVLMFIQAYLPSDAWLLCGLASVVFTLVFAISVLSKRKHWAGMLFLLLLSVALAGLSTWRICDKIILPIERTEKYIGREVRIEATVKQVLYQSDYSTSLSLYVEQISGEYVGASVICECEYFADFYEGDVISLKVLFASVDKLIENGSYTDILVRSNNFTAHCLSTEDSAVLTERASGIYAKILDINRKICTRLCYMLKDGPGGLASALVLGNRDYLSDEISRDFARSGLAHILALSGTHVVLILGFFDKLLLSVFRVGRKGRAAILLLLTPLYVVFVLASSPVLRAGLVYIMVCIANLFGRRYDRITNLFLALLVMVLVDPAALFSVSLWMSFLAAIAISAILPPLNDKLSSIRHTLKHRWLFDICRAVIISVVITVIGVISNILFSWLLFGTLSLVSVSANLIFGPLLTLFLVLSILLVAFLPVTFISGAIAPLISALGEWIIDGISLLSAERYAVISLKYDFAGVICVLFFGLLIGFLLLEIRKKVLVLVPLFALVITFCVCFAIHLSNDTLKSVQVVKRDTNELLAISDGGKYSLIDLSNGRFTTINTAVQSLKGKGACEIETVVLTHYHRYHTSALSRIFSREIVRNLLLPIPQDEYDVEVMERLQRIAEEHGVAVTFLNDFVYTEMSDEVLISPLPDASIKRSTHDIVAFRLMVGEKSVLYLGASFAEGEYADECMHLAREADAVILGRHGPVPKKHILFDSGYEDIENDIIVTDPDVGGRLLRIFGKRERFSFTALPYTLIYASE